MRLSTWLLGIGTILGPCEFSALFLLILFCNVFPGFRRFLHHMCTDCIQLISRRLSSVNLQSSLSMQLSSSFSQSCLDSQLCLPNSGKTSGSCVLLPSWGSCRGTLLRDPCPWLPNVQCLLWHCCIYFAWFFF